MLACLLLLTCGLTAQAAEDSESGIHQTAPPVIAAPLPQQEDTGTELYPSEVKTTNDMGVRKIIKTYTLTAEQNPADIPRDSFVRDGLQFALTDITETRTSFTDTRSHVEGLETSTESSDLNEIIKLLAPVMEYQSADGYSGLLTLDLASVICEEAGRRYSSFTATATREYPHLSNADTSLIPKTITESGRTLTLDSVSWEAQNYTNVDYLDIPDSYRAVASYSANATRSVVTGYITTADYHGEISKVVAGDTVYTAYFTGTAEDSIPASILTPTPTPAPTLTPTREQVPEPVTAPVDSGDTRLAPTLIAFATLAALAGAAAYFYLRNIRHKKGNANL